MGKSGISGSITVTEGGTSESSSLVSRSSTSSEHAESTSSSRRAPRKKTKTPLSAYDLSMNEYLRKRFSDPEAAAKSLVDGSLILEEVLPPNRFIEREIYKQQVLDKHHQYTDFSVLGGQMLADSVSIFETNSEFHNEMCMNPIFSPTTSGGSHSANTIIPALVASHSGYNATVTPAEMLGLGFCTRYRFGLENDFVSSSRHLQSTLDEDDPDYWGPTRGHGDEPDSKYDSTGYFWSLFQNADRLPVQTYAIFNNPAYNKFRFEYHGLLGRESPRVTVEPTEFQILLGGVFFLLLLAAGVMGSSK